MVTTESLLLAQEESAENLELMRLLDEQYLRTPFYGVLKMTECLRKIGYQVNAKRVRRLLRLMGIYAIYPQPRLSLPASDHLIYPYLLRGLKIERVNQVWSTDITYIRLREEFIYLAIVMDVYTRSIRGWRLSAGLGVDLAIGALKMALAKGRPGIHHSDQGVQYAASDYTERLSTLGIQISMAEVGESAQNGYAERVIRTIKEEEVYLNEYADLEDARKRIGRFIEDVYQKKRIHSSLGYLTPAEFEAAWKKRAKSETKPPAAQSVPDSLRCSGSQGTLKNVPLTTVLAAAERLFKEEQGSSCSKEEQGFQRAI
jgi:putative transposase